MKHLILIALLALIGCAQEPPPVDSEGNPPNLKLKAAYQHLLAGDFATARTYFDDRLIAAVLPPSHPDTFESFYQKQVAEWTQHDLNTEIQGNEHNSKVWRVRIGPNDGRPGAVHDLAQIDGHWKIVYWGDYPKE